MNRLVAYVLGTSYCGSSLLNLLLDSQFRIRGLGEAVHLITRHSKATCTFCAAPVDCCPLHSAVDRARFYSSIFDFYSDCDVLVDSSKSFGNLFHAHPFEQQLEHRVLLLSKTPHEFAHSYIGHHRTCCVDGAVQVYLDFYTNQIRDLLRRAWFKPWKCLRLTYHQLATNAMNTISRVLEFLGRDAPVRDCEWNSTSHIVGGNWMVAAQVNGRPDAFRAKAWYLQGKYVDKYHQIFHDNQWMDNKEFVRECHSVYRQRRIELDDVLTSLGQLDYRQQLDTLENALKRR